MKLAEFRFGYREWSDGSKLHGYATRRSWGVWSWDVKRQEGADLCGVARGLASTMRECRRQIEQVEQSLKGMA